MRVQARRITDLWVWTCARECRGIFVHMGKIKSQREIEPDICMHIYIYIYIEREREREIVKQMCGW